MAQTISAAPDEILVLPFSERHSVPRSGEIYTRRRRRLGQVAHLHTERRRARRASFDVAAALELNLDRFPTRGGMLTLLRSWLYAAEREGLDGMRPDYTVALSHAAQIMEQSSEPVAAIALLRARG